MDYLKIPRNMIYQDRQDLKDFGVNDPKTLNSQIFSHLNDVPLMQMEGAKANALQCFNNANYICTLIHLDDFPELNIADYKKIAIKGDSYYLEEVCATTMAIVYEYLSAYETKLHLKYNKVKDKIYSIFFNFKWGSAEARRCFFDMVNKCNKDGIALSNDEFAPRDINEIILQEQDYFLTYYPSYVCEAISRIQDTSIQKSLLNKVIIQLSFVINVSDVIRPDELEYHHAIDIYKNQLQSLKEKDNNQLTQSSEELEKMMDEYEERIKITNEEMDRVLSDGKEVGENEQTKEEPTIQKPQPSGDDQQDIIDDLKAEIEDLKAEIEHLKTQESHISSKYAAILTLTACFHGGGLPKNRENLYPILTNLFGVGEVLAKRRLRESIKEKDAVELASYFEEVSPKIARIIREIPEKLKRTKKG